MAESQNIATDSQAAAPAPAAPTASADELIAELANEDLDRMLSAAEVDRAAPDSSKPDETSAIQEKTPAAAESPISAAELQKQKEVDDVVAQAHAATPDDMAELDSLPSHPDAAGPPSSPQPPTSETAAPVQAAENLEKESESPVVDDRLPFYLLPLDLLRRPLRAIPDPIIDLLGKVAIVTLINAAGILIYIHHFRHK